MMKEKVRSTKLKGTVLYTVISVLMVLIVFLMGTLALAATASNRAMNSYNSAQTQYTAKAGVQAIMSAMQNNKDIAKEIANVDADYPLVNVAVDFGAADAVTGENEAASLGRITSATAEFAGTKWVLNTDTEDENYGKMEEKVVVKISATAQQGRESSTVSAYVLRDAEPKESSAGGGGGFVSTGSAENGTKTSAFGGTYIGYDGAGVGADMDVVNGNTVYESDFHVNGNLNIEVNLDLVIKEPGTGVTVWKDLTLNNGGITISTRNANKLAFQNKEIPYTDIPYIYVDGTFNGGSSTSLTLGSKDIPLNIFCGTLVTPGSDNKVYADIYCYDENGTSFLRGKNRSRLYSWIAQVVDADNVKGDHYAGSIYTKGNLVIEGGSKTIDGDVFVEKDLTITQDTDIYGDIYVGGTFNLNSGNLRMFGGTIYCDNVAQNGGSITAYVDGLSVEYGHKELITGYETETKDDAVPGTLNGEWYWCRPDGTTLQPTYIGSITTGVDAEGKTIYINQWGGTVTPPSYTVYYDPTGAEISKADYDANAYLDIPDRYYDEFGNLYVYEDGSPAKEEHLPEALKKLTAPIEPFGDAKFPAEYEKDIILGNATLPGHENTDSTKIITTVADVMAGAINPYNTLTEVPDTYKPDVESNVKYYNSGEKVEETIEESCTIYGNIKLGSKLYFKVKTGEEIWVVIGKDGTGLTCNNASQLVLLDDDPEYQGTVNFLINGNVTFDSNGGTFPFTTSTIQNLMKTNTDFQIYTNSKYAVDDVEKVIDPIRLNIYCAKNGGNGYTLNIGNSTMLAANITAPYLELALGSGNYGYRNHGDDSMNIYYNGFNIYDDYPTSRYNQIGCIGCCVIRVLTGQSNDFMLLYVPKDTGAPDPGDWEDALMTSWRILYYENY